MELSSKLVSAVFPEFHRFASFMVYTLRPTTFYQSGVYTRFQKHCCLKKTYALYISLSFHQNGDARFKYVICQRSSSVCRNYFSFLNLLWILKSVVKRVDVYYIFTCVRTYSLLTGCGSIMEVNCYPLLNLEDKSFLLVRLNKLFN